jgi:hypothetical protein
LAIVVISPGDVAGVDLSSGPDVSDRVLASVVVVNDESRVLDVIDNRSNGWLG